MKKQSTSKPAVTTLITLLIGIAFSLLAVFFVFFSLEFDFVFKLYRIPRVTENTDVSEIVNIKTTLESLYSVYFSLLLGLPGIYLTVLSIFLTSRNVLSISSFFKYTHTKLQVFLLASAIINIICVLFLPIFKPLEEYSFYYLLFSIVEILVLFILSFQRLLFIENPQMCERLLENKCRKGISNLTDAVKTFDNDFLRPAFKENSMKILQCAAGKKLTKNSVKFFDVELYEIFQKNPQFRKAESLLKMAMENLSREVTRLSFPFPKTEALDLIKDYCSLYFDFYQDRFYCNSITYPLILEISQSISFALTTNDGEFTKTDGYNKLCRIYGNIILRAKDIVVFALHKCQPVDIHSHLKDFYLLVQFFDIYRTEATDNLMSLHEKLWLDIVTHIINLVQMRRLGKDMLLFVYKAIPLMNKIKVYGDESEQYFEILPRIDFHTVIYSRNYYILVLLILCKSYDESLYSETLNRLTYGNKTLQDRIQLYQLLLERAKYIKSVDLALLGDKIPMEKTFEEVKLDLEQNQEDVKKDELNNLCTTDFTTDIRQHCDVIQTKLGGALAKLLEEDKTVTPSYYMPIAYDFSAQAMLKERNTDNWQLTYGFSERMIYELFFGWYVSNNCDEIQVESVSVIEGIENEEVIFASRSLFDWFSNDKTIQFNGTKLNVKGRDIEIFFFNSDKNCLIKFSDLVSMYSVTEIKSMPENCTKEVLSEDVNYTVPFNILVAKKQNKGRVFVRK